MFNKAYVPVQRGLLGWFLSVVRKPSFFHTHPSSRQTGWDGSGQFGVPEQGKDTALKHAIGHTKGFLRS